APRDTPARAGAQKGPPLAPPAPPTPGARPPAPPAASALPPGQGALAVSARFGRDLPPINGSLHWRVYRTEQNGVPRLVKEDKGPAPTFVLPPGPYIVSVGFGLATMTKAVQVRAETMKDVFEIPAGGLRIEGGVGNARIPPGQISFDLYKGSRVEPDGKPPNTTATRP